MKKFSTSAIAVCAGLISLLVFLPALNCGFINLDDPVYIRDNPLIKGIDGGHLWSMFTQSHRGGWLPLTYFSFAVDYHFWGLNPRGYHLTNILLHGFNTGLVVLLADRICRCRRMFAAELPGANYVYHLALILAGLLYGIHPMRVESVAWVSERKDVLNGFFTLLAMYCYLLYGSKQGVVRKGMEKTVSYVLALVFFSVSLLAKQVSVTLPVIFLLADQYLLGRLDKGRIKTVLVEKTPFFVVSLAIVLTTIVLAAGENQLMTLGDLPLSVRLVVSANAIFEYCRQALFPFGLSPYIVLPKPLPQEYLIKGSAVVIVIILLGWRRKKYPLVWATGLYSLITLSPMLEFLHAGDDIALATRYTYLPAVFPSIAIALAAAGICRKWLIAGNRQIAFLVAGLLAFFLVFSGVMSAKLTTVWRDTGTFWTRVIQTSPVGRAYGDRGVFYLLNGKSRAAADDFTSAIAIAANTGLSSVYNLYAFRGVAAGDMGDFDQAVRDFTMAINLFPHPTYFQQRGLALQALGRTEEAVADFRRAGANPPPIDWFSRE